MMGSILREQCGDLESDGTANLPLLISGKLFDVCGPHFLCKTKVPVWPEVA